MIIKIQIVKSIVLEAVQETTYLKGRMDRHTQGVDNSLVADETAGEEDLSKRVFEHDFRTALELLKVIFVRYLHATAQTIGDNVIYYSDKTDDIVEFVLEVSRRYNGTLTDALARLSAKYVEDFIIKEWWIKTTNQKQAEPYIATLQEDVENIKKCFVLSSPIVPKVPYTQTIVAKVDGSELGGSLTLEVGEDETISYSIDDGAIDDIEARSSEPSILEIHRCQEPHAFTLRPILPGIATIKLWSRHSDKVEVEVEALVTEEEV